MYTCNASRAVLYAGCQCLAQDDAYSCRCADVLHPAFKLIAPVHQLALGKM
jgi:hypothetical protein